jgi:hypothetical protein
MMKVYVSALPYSPNGPNKWELVDLSVETAIKELAGNRTIMLQWEDVCVYSIVIESYQDKTAIASMIAAGVFERIRGVLREK